METTSSSPACAPRGTPGPRCSNISNTSRSAPSTSTRPSACQSSASSVPTTTTAASLARSPLAPSARVIHRRSSLGPHQPRRLHYHLRWRPGRGQRAAIHHPYPRGRAGYQPRRRYRRPGTSPRVRHRASKRSCMVRRISAGRPQALSTQARHADIQRTYHPRPSPHQHPDTGA